MHYFTNDFLDFFKDLSKNNHKEWFHAHKKRYETSVKKPFEHFVSDLIIEIQKHDTDFAANPKECIARINRDIRFAKDKTPYNLHYTGFVTHGGKKNKDIPGIFLRFGPEEVDIMGGTYMPPKEQLHKIRKHISLDIPSFRKIISNKEFESKFEGLKGEEHKRIPAEFKIAHSKEPLIARKQFYYVAQREAEMILSKDLLNDIMSYWHAARPVNQYFAQAIR